MAYLRIRSNEPTATYFTASVPGNDSSDLKALSVRNAPQIYVAYPDGKHDSVVQVPLQLPNLKANSLRIGIVQSEFRPVTTLKAPLEIDLNKLARNRSASRQSAVSTPPTGGETAKQTGRVVSLRWPTLPTAKIASGDWGSVHVSCTDWMLASAILPNDLPHGMNIIYQSKELQPSKIARTTAITKKGHRYVWIGNKFLYDYRKNLPQLAFEDLDRIEIEVADMDYKDLGPVSFAPKKAGPVPQLNAVNTCPSLPGLGSIEAHSLVVHDSYEDWYGLVYKPNGEILRGYPGVVESVPSGDKYPQSIGTVYLNLNRQGLNPSTDARFKLFTMPSLTSNCGEPATSYAGSCNRRMGCLFMQYSPNPNDQFVKVSIEMPEGAWKSAGTVSEPIRHLVQLSRKVTRDQFQMYCGFRVDTDKGLDEFFWNGGQKSSFKPTGLRLPAKDLQLRLLAHPKCGPPVEVARMILSKGQIHEVRLSIAANGRPYFYSSRGSLELDETGSLELQMRPIGSPRFLTAKIPPLPVKSKTISMTFQ